MEFFGGNLKAWLLAAVLALTTGTSAHAAEVMAVLIPNGFSTPLPDGSGLTNPLLCEGNVVCGVEEDTDFEIDEENIGGHIDNFVTVKVCEEKAQTSCITVRRAHFSEDPVQDLFPGLAAIITRDFADVPNTILDGGLIYQATMVDHEPIRCEDVTGRFKVPGCAGKLKLDYRCLNMLNFETFEVFTAAGSYIITQTD